MPQPSLIDGHINRALTNISVAYAQSQTDFIADRVFPIVPVAKKSDSYFIYTKADWLRTEARKRAPGTESAGSGYGLSTATYTADVIAVHKDIDDQIRANVDAPIDVERDATLHVTYQILLKRELDWQTAFFATSKWTGSTTGGDITPGVKWDNAASTPIEDIKAQIISVAEKTGRKPNIFVPGPETWLKLSDHPDVVDRIKHTSASPVTAELFARLIGVEQVLVPMATRNTAGEGATATMDFVYGKNALLVYAPPNPGLLTPSGGYTFTWTGYLGARAGGAQITQIRAPLLKVDRVEGESAYVHKLVAADVGTFFSAAVA